MAIDYQYGFVNPMLEPHRPLRPKWDTFGASMRPGHGGLDLYSPPGSPIIATADGTVRTAGRGSTSAGWLVEILHPAADGGWYLTRSMHMMSKPTVTKGQTVLQGEVIGFEGRTGNAISPHNHHEIRYTPSKGADKWTMYGSRWGTRYDPALFGILGEETPVDDEAVKGLQRIAAGRGFDPGPIDGQWGPRTEDAWESMMEAALAGGGGSVTYETVEVVRSINV